MTKQKVLPGTTVHGGAGALRRINENKDFVGLAKVAQDEVERRLANDGVAGELARDALRLQVVSDLYFDAFTKAMQDGDHDRATSMLKVWGWVHNSTIRAWEASLKHRKDPRADNAGKVIEHYRKGVETPGSDDDTSDN